MISISLFLFEENDIFSKNSRILNEIKNYVRDKISTVLLRRDIRYNTTHAIDESVLDEEVEFDYHPKPKCLFQHSDFHNDDPRRMTFDGNLDYRRNNDGSYVDQEVSKRYRSLQLACFMHYCFQLCWKYNSGAEKIRLLFLLYDVCLLCTSIVTTLLLIQNVIIKNEQEY